VVGEQLVSSPFLGRLYPRHAWWTRCMPRLQTPPAHQKHTDKRFLITAKHSLDSPFSSVDTTYLPTKCMFLISTNITWASPTCFSTNVPIQGENNASSYKIKC